jgi:hypothetical protein
MKIEEIKVGTPVIYWGIITEKGERLHPLKTVITSEPWALGHGEVVCKVAGISGGVAISHLDTITAGSLMAAKIQGLAEISNDEIKAATEKFFKDKGVEVTVN